MTDEGAIRKGSPSSNSEYINIIHACPFSSYFIAISVVVWVYKVHGVSPNVICVFVPWRLETQSVHDSIYLPEPVSKGNKRVPTDNLVEPYLVARKPE